MDVCFQLFMVSLSTVSYIFIFVGSLLLAVYPWVMSRTGITSADMNFSHLRKVGTCEFKRITGKRYWLSAWVMILIGIVLQCYNDL